MKEFRVIMTEEKYPILEFNQEELPGIVVINKSLTDFEPKEVFSWHCSVMVHFNQLIENEMPDLTDRTKVEEFEDWLDNEYKRENKQKPNALFLGRITRNKTRELIWRIYEPEKTNEILTKLIETKYNTHILSFTPTISSAYDTESILFPLYPNSCSRRTYFNN